MEKSFRGRGITHLLAFVQTSPSPLKKSLSSIFAEGGGRLRTGYHLPGLPWAIQLSLHFLTKLGEPCFSMRNRKLGSARRVVRSAAGHYCCDGRFTFLAGRTFLPSKQFGSPSRVNTVKVRQSEHARALLSRE